METRNPSELDRRALLKGAAVGVVGAGIAGAVLTGTRDAHAADKKALEDSGLLTEVVDFKNGGDTIHGFLARPKGPGKHGAVILIPGIFGVTDYMKETTAQVAQAGLVGLCVDYYSRKGGPPKTEDFAVLRSFVGENAPDKQIVADGEAALAYLKKQAYVNGKFGVTGFCMGGRITLLLAESSPAFVAAAPFYGPIKAQGPVNVSPMDDVAKLTGAVQGHYGANDMNPKPEDVRAFYDKLKETNPHGEFFIYEGAGHGFHDYSRPSYNPEVATQAWNRTLDFFKAHLK